MYCLFRVLFPPASPQSKHIVDVHVAPRPVKGRGLAKFVKCNVAAAAAAKDLRSFARSFSSVQFKNSSNCYFHSHFDSTVCSSIYHNTLTLYCINCKLFRQLQLRIEYKSKYIYHIVKLISLVLVTVLRRM